MLILRELKGWIDFGFKGLLVVEVICGVVF